MHPNAKLRLSRICVVLMALLFVACTQPDQQRPQPTAVARPATTPPATVAPPATASSLVPAGATPASAATADASPPTTLPSSVATTSAAQPATPASTALLPAPLYVLDQGQIWRLERDGTTRHQVTFEPTPIIAFDLRTTDNGLIYLLSDGSPDAGKRMLVALDASGRTELINGSVGAPLIRPGSSEIAFLLSEPIAGLIIGQDSSPTGIWTTDRTGGRPSLFQPDDPLPDANATATDPPQDVNSYEPISWSPDGARLLMSVYPGYGENARFVIKTVADRTIVDVSDACCGDVAWSADSAALYVTGGVYVQDAALGLWKVDVRTGKATELLPGTIEDKYALIAFPHPAGDAVNVFMTLATEAPEVDPSARGSLIMTRVSPNGARTPLRPRDTFNITAALWAEDGSGAVGFDYDEKLQRGVLRWLPADDGAAVALPAGGADFKWGRSDAVASPQSCDSYTPITWQAPNQRSARPEVADIQRRLLALGYSVLGAADGLYGDQTRDAVGAFQRASGIAASGDVDCATWQALLAAALR